MKEVETGVIENERQNPFMERKEDGGIAQGKTWKLEQKEYKWRPGICLL